jgi:hypothetical protein
LTTASVPDRDKVAYWNEAVSRTLHLPGRRRPVPGRAGRLVVRAATSQERNRTTSAGPGFPPAPNSQAAGRFCLQAEPQAEPQAGIAGADGHVWTSKPAVRSICTQTRQNAALMGKA